MQQNSIRFIYFLEEEKILSYMSFVVKLFKNVKRFSEVVDLSYFTNYYLTDSSWNFETYKFWLDSTLNEIISRVIIASNI